jgi:hypothetical protein
VSFVIVLPADDSRPAELREMGSERSAYEHIREMIGGLVEIVRAHGLHHLAPELWPVMLVDDNGHGKGLPLNQRAGLLYGGEIAGDVVLCQERKRPLVMEPLTGFTREEAWQLQARLPGSEGG